MVGQAWRLALLVWLAPALVAASEVELRFLDVGQGDAILVRDGAAAALVDTGPSDAIVARLVALGVTRLEALVISHNHADHLGGADAVLAAIPVRRYVDNGWPAKSKLQEVVLELVDRLGVPYLPASSAELAVGAWRLRLLRPPAEVGGDEQNNRSLGLVVERGPFRALLTGDAEVEELNHWLAAGLITDVDLLKAGHHGSRNAVTPLLLHRAKPEVVVISCATPNDYGHPHDQALRYYAAGGRSIWRTDQQGEIVVRVEADGRYRVEGLGGAAPSPPPPADERRCCRVCRTGRACGDTCLPVDRVCRTPPGCACDP